MPASFSLYLWAFNHFAYAIKHNNQSQSKIKKSATDESRAQSVFTKIDHSIRMLEDMADAGSKPAFDKLRFFRWGVLRETMKDIEKLAIYPKNR
jgi:hypothetical protein